MGSCDRPGKLTLLAVIQMKLSFCSVQKAELRAFSVSWCRDLRGQSKYAEPTSELAAFVCF